MKSSSRLLILIVLSLGMALPAMAQVKSPDPEKTENIRQLMKMIGVDKLQHSMADQMFDALKKVMPAAQFQDDKSRKMLDRLMEILGEEFKKVDFSSMTLELYDKYFTADEIKGLMQFYSTPVGQKSIQVLPALTQESMGRGMELGQAAGTKAVDRWLDEFPELKKGLSEIEQSR